MGFNLALMCLNHRGNSQFGSILIQIAQMSANTIIYASMSMVINTQRIILFSFRDVLVYKS